jgi:DNA polymerase-3 subunit alpha
MVSTYWNKYNFTVATDSHYLTKDERKLHKEFLNSKESDGNREVDEFYSATYLMSAQEVFNYLSQDFREEKILTMFENSIEIANRCQNYSLFHDQIVPKIQYEWNSRDEEAFYKFSLLMEQYNFTSLDKYIGIGANEADKYLAYLIGEGFMKRIYKDKNTDYKEYFERLNEELYHINAISEARKQPLSDYFNTMNKIVDLIWTDGDSLIGPGRGSACGSLINYLLGITQLDPLRQELTLPFWRFMNESRPDLPD